MKFAIVVFPGSNCDQDCYHVAKDLLGCEAEYVWHHDTDLKGADAVILPGVGAAAQAMAQLPQSTHGLGGSGSWA